MTLPGFNAINEEINLKTMVLRYFFLVFSQSFQYRISKINPAFMHTRCLSFEFLT